MLCSETIPIFLTVRRQVAACVEEESLYGIVPFGKHPCNGKGIAAVISRTCKNNYWCLCIPCIHNGLGESYCSPLHQVNRRNRFVLDSVFIQFVDL